MWPWQKKCKTTRDGKDIFYELILDINDNPFIRRFWVKSRLRKHKKWRRDANRWAEHNLDITITYSVGGTEKTDHFTHHEGGQEVTWGKNISGGMTGADAAPEEVRPLNMKVVGAATREGKTYNLTCKKNN